MIRAIFFDVANTLLHKPLLFDRMEDVLKSEGYTIDRDELVTRHKLLSESIDFPDHTSKDFYLYFNKLLLTNLGILPNDTIVTRLFEECSYLPWEPFADSDVLAKLNLPVGIISNWDLSLNQKLAQYFKINFSCIIGSQKIGLRKPDPRFFAKILDYSGLKPEHILVIGDSVRLDIVPSLKLGMQAKLIDRINLYSHASVDRIQSLHEILLIETAQKKFI